MFLVSLKCDRIGGVDMEKREYEITRVYNTENVKEISIDRNGNKTYRYL